MTEDQCRAIDDECRPKHGKLTGTGLARAEHVSEVDAERSLLLQRTLSDVVICQRILAARYQNHELPIYRMQHWDASGSPRPNIKSPTMPPWATKRSPSPQGAKQEKKPKLQGKEEEECEGAQ